MTAPMVRGTARRLGLQRARPLAFTQTARPTESTDPCSPEWEPTAVFPVGMLNAVYSWQCACGAEPRFGSVFAVEGNARSDFIAHVMRAREAGE